MRYYLDPFGCVKNQVDAETIMALLNVHGGHVADTAEYADCIIINSCGFIESAKQESINAVLAYRKQYPDKKIIMTGCLAERYAAELSESLPEADLFIGNRDLSLVPTAVHALMSEHKPVQPSGNPVPTPGTRPLLSLPGSAYIKISEGCNNYCSFCAIPLIRGPLKSRPVADIVSECQILLERGIRELCIIGQDVGSYGLDTGESALLRLLESLSRLKGDFWLRLLYLHPDHFPQSILELFCHDPRLLPYFDIPFQHGSTSLLHAMNRHSTVELYYALIDQIRSTVPDAVIRSTFLTGFPGETEEDFQALLTFQEKAALDWAGCFAYSREEGTSAYSLMPRVPKKVALQRKSIIEERQIAISEKQMDKFVGRTTDVLVEEVIDTDDQLYLGRIFCQAPEVDGATVITSNVDLVPGTFVQGKIRARIGFDLEVTVHT